MHRNAVENRLGDKEYIFLPRGPHNRYPNFRLKWTLSFRLFRIRMSLPILCWKKSSGIFFRISNLLFIVFKGPQIRVFKANLRLLQLRFWPVKDRSTISEVDQAITRPNSSIISVGLHGTMATLSLFNAWMILAVIFRLLFPPILCSRLRFSRESDSFFSIMFSFFN